MKMLVRMLLDGCVYVRYDGLEDREGIGVIKGLVSEYCIWKIATSTTLVYCT